MTHDENTSSGNPVIPERQKLTRNAKGNNAPRSAKLERHAGDEALGAGQAQGGDTRRFLVRITSRRRRLIDEDNLCEKVLVDCCRYSGLISGDTAGETKIEVSQQQVKKEDSESTLIEVFAL